MRKAVFAALLMAAAPGGLSPTHLHAQQVQVSSANRAISVTATETAERRAEIATLHLGYQIYGATSEAVNQQAATLSAAIVKAVEDAGAAKDAIASENQGTGPVEPYQENGLTPEQKAQKQFQAQQSWTVRCTPGTVARILAAALGAGANQSGSVDWTVSDVASLTSAAAAKALVQARQIAAQMASGLNAKVGPLLYASNQSPEPVVIRGAPQMNRMAAGAAQPIQPLSMSPPMISRTATVVATFAIQ